MTQDNNAAVTRKLRLTNSKSAALEVWLEPLGDRVSLLPGATFEFCMRDPVRDCPALVMTDESIALYGWVQEVLAVSSDGKTSLIWEIPQPQPAASATS